jgi:hypothetical protein
MRNQKGQSIVEFALVLPLLLVILMGIVDFGWVLHHQTQLDHAVRVGARRGAVGETNATIINRMQDGCVSFVLEEEDITIEVRDPTGSPIGDSEDRTPDYTIYVAINKTVDFHTPLSVLYGVAELHSDAEFLIE